LIISILLGAIFVIEIMEGETFAAALKRAVKKIDKPPRFVKYKECDRLKKIAHGDICARCQSEIERKRKMRR